MTENEKKILSVTEAAKILGVSRNLAYEGVMRGQIPSIRIGRRILVPRVALDKLLQNAGTVTAKAA